jgi:hypothetical protein
MAYQKTLTTMLEMFLDNTAGETYGDNRLVTRENDAGDVTLVAYGWLKVAAYNEDRDAVTVFTGHQALQSKTVNRWTNEVVNAANERGRSVIISGESPTVDTPNDGVKYIDNYISMTGTYSDVEADAKAEVEASLEDVSA